MKSKIINRIREREKKSIESQQLAIRRMIGEIKNDVLQIALVRLLTKKTDI